MTKSEKQKLRYALRDITEEDRDFTRGIAIIADLCGMDYSAYRTMLTLKTISIKEAAIGPNRPFSVKLPEKEPQR